MAGPRTNIFGDPVDEPFGPTMAERKTGADIDQSGASAEGSRAGAGKAREETITERELRQYKVAKAAADATAAKKDADKPRVTPGQQKADEEYAANDYIKWRTSGGMASLQKDLQQYAGVLQRLKGGDDNISGPVIGNMPDGFRSTFYPKSTDTQQQVEQLLTSSGGMKQALDSQFAAREAQQVFERAFNPKLEEGYNLERSRRAFGVVLQTAATREAAADYFDKHGTLVGFNPASAVPIMRNLQKTLNIAHDDMPTLATAGDEDGQTGDTPQGEKVQSWRLSPEAVATIRDYIQSPNFTIDGYARMVTAKAFEEGHVKPEQMGSYYQAMQAEAQNFFGKFHSDEERIKGTGPGFDYSKADEQAQEQAGLGTNLIQAAKNIPESGAALIKGFVALPADAIMSVASRERVGSFKGVTDLAAELIRMAGGQPEGPTVKALGDMIEQRYGGWDNIKNTMVTDPVGFAGDLSLALTGGGGATAKLGEVANMSKLAKVGEGVRAAGQFIDPLSRGTQAVGAVKEVTPDVVKALPGKVAAGTLGLTTGAGGEGFARAAGVGFERGQKGPTARSDAFLDQMRGGDPEAAIEQAKTAVAAIRQEASDRYRSGMVDISKDKTQLDFGDIDNALLRLSRIGNYKGAEINSAAQKAYAEVRNVIDEWRAKDPAEFHTPEGMDALKQKIWDVAGNLAEGGDRRAAKVVKGLYQSVKQTINKQAPAYASVMKDYERASEKLNNITKTFSLNPNASVDTQLRKLQSVLRNNANTNYGYRRDLAGLMEQYGGPEMVDALSAHSLNSAWPRGLQRLAAGTAATSGAAGLIPGAAGATALANPVNLALLPLMSPKLMGEASYYAGAGAGKVSLGLEKLAQAYNAHPTATLALAAGGEHSSDLEDLAARYGLGDTDFLTKTVYGGR